MQKFFCGGPLKSGTTFLQRVLDSHPEICCQPENNLNDLFVDLMEVYGRHNRRIDFTASILGVQPFLSQTDAFAEGFFKIIDEFFKIGLKKKKICGINDNHFINHNADSIHQHFDNVKIIYIIRNPFDTALSYWDHNHKIAIKMKDNRYLSNLTTDGKTLDKNLFLKNYSIQWSELVQVLLSSAKKYTSTIMIVKYEDLVCEKKETLSKIFNFLGASSEDKILEKIIHESSLDFMKKNSTNPNFYQRGRINFGKNEISDEIFRYILDKTKTNFDLLNYRIN